MANTRTDQVPANSDPVPSGGSGKGGATDAPKAPKDLNELKDAKRVLATAKAAEADIALQAVLTQLLANPLQGVVVADNYVAAAARKYGLDVSNTSGGYYVQVPD